MNLQTLLSGNKTYIMGALMILGGVVATLAPDSDLIAQFSLSKDMIAQGLALVFLRQGVAKVEKKAGGNA